MWDKRAWIQDVHDGDTLTVVLDQGFGDTKLIKLRLLNTFAPELSQPGGQETRQFVIDWLAKNKGTGTWNYVVTTARTPKSDTEQETFGRYVGVLTNTQGTENLNLAVTQFVRDNGYGGGTGA